MSRSISSVSNRKQKKVDRTQLLLRQLELHEAPASEAEIEQVFSEIRRQLSKGLHEGS